MSRSRNRPVVHQLHRTLLIGIVGISLVTLGLGQVNRARNARIPLLCAAVGLQANGNRQCLTQSSPQRLYPDTRVIQTADPHSLSLVSTEKDWLAASTIPSLGPEYDDMVRSALLDLHVLTQANGALVAGWPAAWRYVWPRDASFAAVALTKSGHLDDAARILGFLQARQPANGVFQARYLPDGSGVPDARGEQTDGTGWVLWALGNITADLDPAAQLKFLTPLRPLAITSTEAALRLSDTADGLPAPSPDYWEVPDKRLSLGTAAPLAAGLAAATQLMTLLAEPHLSNQAAARALTMRTSITSEFGRNGYGRYLGKRAPDASITFLMPPFTASASPDVLATFHAAARAMRRPAGGLAPGADWKNDGISWTPETALFALASGSTGDLATARARLTWLAEHQTADGTLPEKVLSNGHPAGPAPLAWTDALVILTAEAIQARDGS